MEAKLPLSAEAAAERLSIGRTKIFELMASGQLESFTIGRRRVVPADALEAFVQRQRQPQVDAAPCGEG